MGGAQRVCKKRCAHARAHTPVTPHRFLIHDLIVTDLLLLKRQALHEAHQYSN